MFPLHFFIFSAIIRTELRCLLQLYSINEIFSFPFMNFIVYEALWQVCSILCEKFGKHGLVKPKPAVRSLAAPLRMFDGMDEEEVPKKKPEVIDGPLLTERDRIKLERRKRKEERQREVNPE